MANEKSKREEIQDARLATDSNVRELQETVAALPRTDHMTLPAVMINKIDDETAARMRSINAANRAVSPDAVINKEGKTLQEVRNEFEFGVSDLSEEGGKHSFKVEGSKGETESITIVPPQFTIINAQGEEEEIGGDDIVITPTPANIAPVDADAPHNPVEAREAAGLNPDGSEGDAGGGIAPPVPSGTFSVKEDNSPSIAGDLGTAPKVGGDTPASRPIGGDSPFGGGSGDSNV